MVRDHQRELPGGRRQSARPVFCPIRKRRCTTLSSASGGFRTSWGGAYSWKISSYISYRHSDIPEAEFLRILAEEADCLLLLDVNNVYVSARNYGFGPYRYLSQVPAERVWQIHLAGHSDYGSHVIDTHDHAVADRYGNCIRRPSAAWGRLPP